jgi:hypothetical protein
MLRDPLSLTGERVPKPEGAEAAASGATDVEP